MRKRTPYALAAGLFLLLSACRPNNMAEQPRYENFEASNFFEDGRVARQPVPGTIPREGPLPGSVERTGIAADGFLATESPLPVDRKLLDRGRGQYQVYCAVCHGSDGHGEGIVVRRGFPPPPTFHSDRLRDAPLGYFVHVINRGYGIMYPYHDRVAPDDRWAIAAYLRALQLSQQAGLEDLSAEDRRKLEEEARP